MLSYTSRGGRRSQPRLGLIGGAMRHAAISRRYITKTHLLCAFWYRRALANLVMVGAGLRLISFTHPPFCAHAFSRPRAAKTIFVNIESLRPFWRKKLSYGAPQCRPSSVKIKSRYFAVVCGLKHVLCMSNLLGIFVLGHYGALYTQNDENDAIFF